MQLALFRTAIFCFALGCAPVKAQYSRQPFEIQAVEPARALVESMMINNWLNENLSRISEQQRQGAREHLHALIDAQVKQSFLKRGTLAAPQPEGTLAPLYSWAGRLGVYGADLVYAAVRGTYPAPVLPGPTLPKGLSISLVKEHLALASEFGQWRALIPYYFFVFRVESATAANGKETEVFLISTGTAPDSAPPGYSQATIAVFFEHGRSAEFEDEWVRRLGFRTDSPVNEIGSTPYKSRVKYDSGMKMHQELVYLQNAKGSFAILYGGLDGTYQANRGHFEDFMRMISVTP